MHWYYGGYPAGGLMMFIGMLLFWLPVIGLIVWAISRFSRPAAHTPPAATHTSAASPEARAILDRRFANGEIDAEEYARMRRVLETGSAQ